MAEEKISAISRSAIFYAIGISVILLLLRLLPFLLPHSRLWGINHLLFLSEYFTYITIVFGILAIALLMRPLHRIGDSIFEYISGILEHPRYMWWMAIAFGSLIPFWFLRMPTNMLGDGYTFINNIGNDLPVMEKWSEVGAIKLVHALYQLLPYSGLKGAEYAYALVSVTSGGVTLFLFFLVAYELGRDKTERLFILCLQIFSGWLLLFFGYAENYPVLWPFMVGYIYFSIRYIKGQTSLVLPTLFLLIALLLHVQIVFFLISYLVLITAHGYGARFFHKNKGLSRGILGLIAIIGGVLFVWRYQNVPDFQFHFMPLINGRSPVPGYTLLSISHLLDIVNEFLLIIPLLPLLIFMGWQNRKAILKDGVDRFLSLFTLGGLILILIFDPKLGMGRDWDLFALTGFGTLLLLARMVILSSRWKRFFPGAILFSAVLFLPYLATNLSYQPSLDYYKWLLNLDLARAKPGFTTLRDYYHNTGDSARVDSLQREIAANFPSALMGPKAYNLAKAGRFGEALAIIDSLFRIDPHAVESYNLRGSVYLQMGNFERAIPDFEYAVRFGQYNVQALLNMAQAYQQAGRVDDVLKPLRQAQKLAPRSERMLIGLSSAFFARKQYDSALVYAEKTILESPSHFQAYLAAGLSAYNLRDYVKAKAYLTRFLESAPEGPERNRAVEIMQQFE